MRITNCHPKENKMKQQLWQLWFALLNDDAGINEESYNALLELAQEIDPEELQIHRKSVEATDGQFYIPED